MAGSPNSVDGSYSFVMQADSSVSSDSPTQVNNNTFPKQKRRRTSPRDHSILEAAYQRNSKPDKHERTEIVSQVELGEKEVQIWFQNRRQNDRRKSKPLMPHELLAIFRSAAGIPSAQNKEARAKEITRSGDAAGTLAPEIPRPSSRSSSIHELLNPASAEPISSQQDKTMTQRSSDMLPTPPSSFKHNTKSNTTSTSTAPAQADTKQPEHTRKRSYEIMTQEEPSNTSTQQTNGSVTAPQPRLLARSSSFVRLAMTADGAVKVRTNNEPTPSPPKQRTLPPIDPSRKRESFGRSHSAIENGFVFTDINPPIHKVGAAGFGRSRDARTWEFYCDKDSGDALSTQAEAERNGSAVGAINLIRSRSQRHKVQALSPNPAKQNTHRAHAKRHNDKPKLLRAMSSMGRLQNSGSATESAKANDKGEKHVRSPSGDSDKENWAPGTRTSTHAMRRIRPSAPRSSILQENDFPTARDVVAEIQAPAPESKDSPVKVKAKGDDLDCIQGLLSLSQGAWR